MLNDPALGSQGVRTALHGDVSQLPTLDRGKVSFEDLGKYNSVAGTIVANPFKAYGGPDANRYAKLVGVAKQISRVIQDFQGLTSVPSPGDNVYIPVLRGLRVLRPDQPDDFTRQTQVDYGLDVARVFTGQTLYSEIRRLLLGSRSDRERYNLYLDFLSSEFFGGKSFSLRPFEETGVLYASIGDEKEFPLAHLGDGLQSVVLMTFRAFAATEPSIYFIEEPELYLHPGLQRKMVQFFTSSDTHHFFITTHSNHILDLSMDFSNVSVFRLGKSGNGKVDHLPTFKVVRVSHGDQATLQALGVRASSVFLVNATIWVEGVTDRLYLRKMLDLYQKHLMVAANPQREVGQVAGVPRIFQEDIHFTFVEYGGSNITHWSFLDDGTTPTIEVERLCAEAFVVSDQDGEDAKLDRKERLTELLGNRYHCLPVREIENLLPPSTIWAVVRSYEDPKRKGTCLAA